MSKVILLLIGILIIGAIIVATLHFLGVVEMDTEMLMTVLIVIIVFEVAVMVAALLLRKRKKKIRQPPLPQPVPAQPQLPQQTQLSPVTYEPLETIPTEIIEYKVPGTVRSIGSQANGTTLIGVEVKKIPPSMKFGHDISIVKEKIEKIVLEKEPIIKKLPETPSELESVVLQLIDKTKKSKPKVKKKPKRIVKKKKEVRKKHGKKK